MKEKFKQPASAIRLLFGAFTVLCLLAAVIAAACGQGALFAGVGRICTQSGQTVKSYFDASYGGVAGTFLNVALVCAVCLGIYCLPGAKPDGVSVLAFFLTAGFCFWGTTILNIWFSFAGVLLFCAVKKKSPGAMANAFLFSTGLAPLITEMLFRYPGEAWHGFTALGFVLALAVGVVIGFIFPAVLPHSPKMHKGYDLYNAAVPIGLTAFFLRALLYKVFTPAPPASEGVGLADSFELVSFLFCGVVFGLAILCGLLLGVALLFFGHNTVSNFMINVVRSVGGNETSMGLLNAFMASTEIPIMFLYDRLTRRVKCPATVRFAGIMFAVKAAAFVLAPNMLGLYGACALQSLSFALLIPASVRYVNLYIAPADCAKGQALIAGMTSLGSIFASFVGGMLYDMTSVKITLLVGFAAAAAGAVLCQIGTVRE